jgi:hypothetical protein
MVHRGIDRFRDRSGGHDDRGLRRDWDRNLDSGRGDRGRDRRPLRNRDEGIRDSSIPPEDRPEPGTIVTVKISSIKATLGLFTELAIPNGRTIGGLIHLSQACNPLASLNMPMCSCELQCLRHFESAAVTTCQRCW